MTRIPVYNKDLKLIQLFMNEELLSESYVSTILDICARQAMANYKKMYGESCDVDEWVKILKKEIY